MYNRTLLISMLLSFSLTVHSLAQTNGPNDLADNFQPGNRLHNNIEQLQNNGITKLTAIAAAIDTSLLTQNNTLTEDAKLVVAFDLAIANDFYAQMLALNSLIDVTKILVELHSEKIAHVITLGVVLYPETAQEVYDGAALTGLIKPDDILAAVLQAGADPSSVSASLVTSRNADMPAAGNPLGVGIGAGGTGGGDITASKN